MSGNFNSEACNCLNIRPIIDILTVLESPDFSASFGIQFVKIRAQTKNQIKLSKNKLRQRALRVARWRESVKQAL
jgi:hypothetical protein